MTDQQGDQVTLLPRYRYEFYRDDATGETQRETWYKQRAQWLIFDAHSVGCMCSVGTEREAARIVFALNKLDGTKHAGQFEEIPWRERPSVKLANSGEYVVSSEHGSARLTAVEARERGLIA